MRYYQKQQKKHEIFDEKFLKKGEENSLLNILSLLKNFFFRNKHLFFLTSLFSILTSIINYNIGSLMTNLIGLFKDRQFAFQSIFSVQNDFNFFLYGNKVFTFKTTVFSYFCWLAFVSLILKSLFSLYHYYINSYGAEIIEKDLKINLFNSFIESDYYQGTEVSRDLYSQFSSDLDFLASSLWSIVNRSVYVLSTIISQFIHYFVFESGDSSQITVSIWIKISFFISSIISFSLLGWVEVYLFRKAARLNVEAKKRYDNDNKFIYERIDNFAFIKTVSGEEFEKEKVSLHLEDTFNKNWKAILFSILYKAFPAYVIIPNIPFISFGLGILFSLLFVKKDNFPLKPILGLFIGIRHINSEVEKVIQTLSNLEIISANVKILRKLINSLEKGKVKNSSLKKWENGDILFESLSFAYPSRPDNKILNNFNFTFKAGKSAGVLGKNGVGKSTISRIILKFYSNYYYDGKVFIGKNDLNEIAKDSLQRSVCYQTNRPPFFGISIAENVFYPYVPSEDYLEKLTYAAEKTGILQFIEQLPQGFDTILKIGGSDLSEGQKQQIFAMRIFIHEYDVYILDEILSNVNHSLKEKIIKNIFEKIKGKTIIAIDHHYQIFNFLEDIYEFSGQGLIKLNKEDYLNEYKSEEFLPKKSSTLRKRKKKIN